MDLINVRLSLKASIPSFKHSVYLRSFLFLFTKAVFHKQIQQFSFDLVSRHLFLILAVTIQALFASPGKRTSVSQLKQKWDRTPLYNGEPEPQKSIHSGDRAVNNC